MTPPRCSYSRHCGEEVIGTGPDNLPYCFDHLNEAKAEAEREREQVHMDEHGRNKAVMRNARAM